MRQTWQSGIDIRAASVYSGMFSQIFKQECGLYRDTVFFFVRMSIQEFLAAHYVLLSFIYIAFERADRYQPNSKRSKAQLLQQSAVDMALQSRNGHLYLFLHVPLWLSLETNQILLQGLLGGSGSSSQTNQGTGSYNYIKRKISKRSPGRSFNRSHCLNQLNKPSLVQEVQQYSTSGSLSRESLPCSVASSSLHLIVP